jgi:hypothetical protein
MVRMVVMARFRHILVVVTMMVAACGYVLAGTVAAEHPLRGHCRAHKKQASQQEVDKRTNAPSSPFFSFC